MLLLDREQRRRRRSCRAADVQRFYNDNIAAVPDAGTDPRQPHPAQDRRQGRSDRPQAGRGHPEAGEGGADFAALAKQVLGGRGLEGQRRRPRLLRPRPDGAGIRDGGVRAEAGTDQRPREVAVRLPHHQGGGQEAGGDAHRSTRCGRRSRSSSKAQRTDQQITDRATELAGRIDDPADLDTVARELGATVPSPSFFAREDPDPGPRRRAAGGGSGVRARRTTRSARRSPRRAARCSSP